MKSVKKALLLIAIFATALIIHQTAVFAQAQPPQEGQEKYWKVPGYRHGPSFFPRTYYVEATPLREGVLDFRHYHPFFHYFRRAVLPPELRI
ncbi:hypothetical protein ACFL6I_29445, partial [candidate division KSB1 bacterium]